MAIEVTLRQAGGSVSATIPAEMARRFHLSPGDRVQAIETEQGILLSPFDPTVEEALALASAAARQFQPALRELALLSNTPEPRWVPCVAVQAIHRQQTLEHGGLQGIRSQDALDAALARPQQPWSYGELSTIPQLAAAHAEAIVRAHPFVDGNKRSGFLVAVVFLGLNGFSFQGSNESVVLVIQRLAAGELPWEELEAWFASQSSPIAR